MWTTHGETKIQQKMSSPSINQPMWTPITSNQDFCRKKRDLDSVSKLPFGVTSPDVLIIYPNWSPSSGSNPSCHVWWAMHNAGADPCSQKAVTSPCIKLQGTNIPHPWNKQVHLPKSIWRGQAYSPRGYNTSCNDHYQQLVIATNASNIWSTTCNKGFTKPLVTADDTPNYRLQINHSTFVVNVIHFLCIAAALMDANGCLWNISFT